jgi:hypothetical protein
MQLLKVRFGRQRKKLKFEARNSRVPPGRDTWRTLKQREIQRNKKFGLFAKPLQLNKKGIKINPLTITP